MLRWRLAKKEKGKTDAMCLVYAFELCKNYLKSVRPNQSDETIDHLECL